MKKIFLGAIIAFLTIGLHATEYTKKDRLEDMRGMTASLNKIQRSLVGRCKTCIYQGKDDLYSFLKAIESVDAKDYLPKDQANAYKFANKMAKNIKVYSEAMIEAYEEKNYFEAMDMYNLVQNQCISCHLRVRDWDANHPKK